jgi:putative transposase
VLTGRRYLLAFTPEQAEYAEQVGNACRAVWNTALEQRRVYAERYKRDGHGVYPSYALQCRELTEAKAEHTWLAEAPSHCLQQTLRDLDKAATAHGVFKVRWRSKVKTPPAFRFPEGKHISVERLNRKWARVKLPKLGWVRFRWTRPLGGTIRNATVSRQAGRWYISFCIEDGITEVAPSPRPPVGVDRGVKVAVATSEGELFDQQFITPGEAKRLKRLQQSLSRSLRVHGRNRSSNRRDAVRAALGQLNARIRARRTDFNVQTAHRLVSRHGLVAVEDLKTANMTLSAKGTVDAPGRNVRQKAGLNRAILNKGWGGFLLALQSAARYTGTEVVKANPAYTSQTCHACKHVARESRESQAVFRCVACGHQDNADVNAAKNILAAGLAVTGRGDLAVGRFVKRQSPERSAA